MSQKEVFMPIDWFVLVLLACTVAVTASISGTSDAGQSTDKASSAAAEGVPGGGLIKAVIVNYLRAGAKHPELRQEHELEWSVFKLLALFEGLNDRKSLKALGELEAFYLGEAPGEMLDCLVVRKGASITKILSDLKRTGSQDCRAQLGLKSTACRSDDELRRELDILIKRIDGKETCAVEP